MDSDEDDWVPPAPAPGTNIDFDSVTLFNRPDLSLPGHIFIFEDAPWLGGPHDGHPISTSIHLYFEARLNSRDEADIPMLERAALWQAALTFGLLEATMEMQIQERFLVRQEVHSETSPEALAAPSSSCQATHNFILTDANLPLLFYDWRLPIRALMDADVDSYRAWRVRIDDVLEEAYGLLMSLVSDAHTTSRSIFHRAGLPETTVACIIGAYSALAEALIGARRTCFPGDDSAIPRAVRGEDAYTLTFIHAPDATGAIERRMIDGGWCPFVVESLGDSIVTLGYAARLAPVVRAGSQGHARCTESECTMDNIDEGSYKVRHVEEGCGCEFIRPPLEDVLAALAEDAVPVIVPEERDLRVRRACDVPYVAISHVWADGLGSVTDRGLPSCQIARIAALARELVPSGAFWMDSLCVPSKRDARVRAIGLMAKTYSDAAVVLVTDSSLRQCPSTAPLEERLLRIASCGWLQRIWTLQEALLARRLVLQLSDALVDLDELLNAARDVLDVHFHPLLHSLRQSLSRLSLRRAYPDRHLSFGTVVRAMSRRTTSRTSDETLAVAGLLAGVDARELVPLDADARMRHVLLATCVLPRAAFAHRAPKLRLPGFGWAPRTLLCADAADASALSLSRGVDLLGHVTADGAALCTPHGLVAEYVLMHFPEKCVAPGEIWKLVGVEGGSACAVAASAPRGAPKEGYTCDALLFVKPNWPVVGEYMTAAAVTIVEADEMALDVITDAERVVCEFKTTVMVMGLGLEGSERDTDDVVEGETLFVGVRLI